MEKLTINELFSGIGAQVSALEKLGIPFEIRHTSDIDHNAVLAYASIHCGLTEELINTYTEYPTREEMARQLTEINLGYDFQKSKPYNWYRFVNSKSKELEKYWLANKLSKNLGDISKLEYLDYADFWTYSFPCTDISVAGKQEGIKHGKTRSGLLYEVQRLLERANKMLALPKYLMLENVKNLVGKKFKPQFDEWVAWLDELGYNTYWKVLNAKDYGVPQNRERVFAISIRKDIDDGKFEFPQPFDNGVRLKDVLEDNVDKKYYLSEEIQNRFIPNNENLDTNIVGTTKGKHNHRIGQCDLVYSPNGIMGALVATDYKQPKQILETNRCVKVGDLNYYPYETSNRIYSKEGISPTLTTMQGGNTEPKIAEPIAYVKEATKKGYAEIYEGDSVNLEQPNSKTRRGKSRQGCIQTLTTSCNQAVIEPEAKSFRVRKLTPKECYRLMGFTDEQFDRSQTFSSDSQLYKQAGNSIVVDVLYYIFGKLFEVDTETRKETEC